MSKTLCPKCSDILPMDARACACGWRKEARTKDAINLDCTFNDHGHVCGQRGSMTESTLGGGPWYCSKHWWIIKGYPLRKTNPSPYRERWYAEHQKPVKPPILPAPIEIPVVERQPGEDEEFNLATQA